MGGREMKLSRRWEMKVGRVRLASHGAARIEEKGAIPARAWCLP